MQNFNGMLDDISIWDRPLSKWEVRRLSFSIMRGDEQGLLGYWSFNEGTGLHAYDHTIQKNNGVIHGSFRHVESNSKPLLLPNVKKNWQVAEEPFLDPELL